MTEYSQGRGELRRTCAISPAVSNISRVSDGAPVTARGRTRGVSGRIAAALCATTLLLAGCESAPAVGDGPYAKILGRAIPKVEQATGLTFKETPVLESRSKAQVREFLLKQLTDERAQRTLAGQERVYKRLGLVPDSLDVAALLQELLEEQIVGYYDPATKVLYVVDDVKPELLDVTITHELVHALQDQYVNIDSIQSSTDNADRQVTAQAILEGQAVYAQLRASLGETGMRLGGWERARIAMRDAQSGMPVFSAAPMIVRESLLFPYTGGADFMHRFTLRRPTDNVLADFPISTRQLLNDGAYFGPEDKPLAAEARETPTLVTLPEPSRGTVVFTNVFGELETRLVMYQFVTNEVQAGRAAQGVDGDRYALIELPKGDALVWASVWDNTVEAAQFVDAFTPWLKQRYPGIGTRDEEDATVRRWGVAENPKRGVLSARSVRVEVHPRGERMLVLIVDAPLGEADGLIDPARITLEP